MTLTDLSPALARELPAPVALDLYRDIHKGIRAELFAVVGSAGSIDPSSSIDRAALAAHLREVAAVLESHAHHEDATIDPALRLHLPALAEQVELDHTILEARFTGIVELAEAAASTAVRQRDVLHHLYLELSGFTSAYLQHQLLEETLVMPALERAVGVEAVVAMHQAIVSSIPPDEMARSLAFMLPAMNPDDRAELLAGMRAGAPAEVFQQILGLARSVLSPAAFDATLARLG